MDYHKDTQKLIDRMCANIERGDFELDKEKATECLMKTYDLFNLPRPKNTKWMVDIFDKDFEESARSAGSAGSARSAGSAWSAGSARSAGSAGSAGSAWSARSARSAWSAWSARSARSARSAWSARSARSAWSALDYDFDWYIFEFEYCKNPDKDLKPNENDKKYLEYCELLMQAKEHGMGYRVAWEDTLYLVPTPLVLIDEQNNFHSITDPAIRWKGGSELFYIHGVNFDKKLWKKIVEKTIKPKELLGLSNIEQRMVAMKVYGMENLLSELNANLLDKSERGNELYLLQGLFPANPDAYFLKYACPSTGRVYVSGIDPAYAKKNPKADLCMAWKFGLTGEEYTELRSEA